MKEDPFFNTTKTLYVRKKVWDIVGIKSKWVIRKATREDVIDVLGEQEQFPGLDWYEPDPEA